MVELPEQVDVAIVGAGIIGMSTALALSQAGVRCAVFEKGRVAGEQSSRNWGWIRTLGRNAAELPLALHANRLWAQLQQQVDVGYRQTGLTYLGETPEDLAQHRSWLAAASESGVDARVLSRDELSQILPSASRRNWSDALYSASDGVAEPELATQAIAGLAAAHGCQLFEGCAVRGLDVAAGRATGVVTERGRVAAQAVVLAGGAWSRLFCGNTGIAFPQLKVHASALATHPLEAGIDLAVNGKDFTCRKRADGGYTVSQLGASFADLTPDSIRLFRQFMPAWLAERKYLKLRVGRRFIEEWKLPRHFDLDHPTPFEQCRVLDPAPTAKTMETALRKLKEAFPAFEQATIARSWAGFIDVTPDALPVISPVETLPGFFLASGFSGHGFGIGPSAGALMADLVQGNTPGLDPRAFRLARFTGR